MIFCCCSLAGTAACMRCLNNPGSAYTPPISPQISYPPAPRIKKTIETLDENGKCIKREIIYEGENE